MTGEKTERRGAEKAADFSALREVVERDGGEMTTKF